MPDLSNNPVLGTVAAGQVAGNGSNAINNTANSSMGSGQNVGLAPAPITYGQQAALFQDPNTAALSGAINGLPTNYASPMAGLTTLNTAASNPLIAGQISNINALNAQAQGLGPSPATIAAQQQAQQNIAQQASLLGSARGSSNPALAMRSAGVQGAQLAQQGVQAAAAGKVQEELNAQQQLAGALNGTTGQVMQGAQAQGTMNQNIGLANQAQQGTTNALNAGQTNAQLQAAMGLSNTDLTAAMNYGNLVTGQNTQLQGIAKDLGINNTNNMLGLTGAGIAGGATLGAGALAASDMRLKTAIKRADRNIKHFLSHFTAPSTKFNLMEVI